MKCKTCGNDMTWRFYNHILNCWCDVCGTMAEGRVSEQEWHYPAIIQKAQELFPLYKSWGNAKSDTSEERATIVGIMRRIRELKTMLGGKV